jgi:hypothetical protein
MQMTTGAQLVAAARKDPDAFAELYADTMPASKLMADVER